MATTYRLGGSPLGIIGALSRPSRDNMSTFNSGKSRNVNVISYNRGRPQETNISQGGQQVIAARSLFTGGAIPNFYPNPDPVGMENDELGLDAASKFKNPNDQEYREKPSKVHNDRMYDLSILNIVEVLSKSGNAALRPGDFAYLKHIGVYPNNRLMIARRFGGPVGDNIFGKSGGGPKSVLISWRPENEDFLSFSFGEEWMEADADFTAVINKMGKDFGLDNLGGAGAGAFNLIPLPGFSEVLQRMVLEEIGVLEKGSGTSPLPSGNPNIIKQAKRRKTVGYGEAASGLRCSISVKMTCEYEQKFISGIDPSMAFMDIINNIAIFGTSKSDNYGISSKLTQTIKEFLNDPGSIVRKILAGIDRGIREIVGKLKEAAEKVLKALDDAVDSRANSNQPAQPVDVGAEKDKNADLVNKAKGFINKFLNKINDYFKTYLTKYKVEILGIANALSGAPSSPWHLTIGNPLRPFFCCGDMLAGDVTLSFGPHLAFNDLPSTIKAEFTLTNARPQGLQEILAKFNVGHLRVVNIKKDYIETDREETSSSGQYFDAIFDASGNKLNEVVKVEGKSGSSQSGSSQSSTTDAQIETQAMNNLKKEKEELDKLKKDKGENSEEYKKALAEFEKKKKEQVEKLKNDAKLGANNNNTPPNGNGNSNPNSGTSGTSGTSTQTTTSGTSGTSGT
jgi:hypothetical protein